MRKQMTYRTGEITPKRIDQEYPRQIEISIPSGGLGTRLNDHHEFCHRGDSDTQRAASAR